MKKAKPVQTPDVDKTPAGLEDLSVTVGDRRSKSPAGPKTSGIRMRGAGAAKKGVMSRGPMG